MPGLITPMPGPITPMPGIHDADQRDGGSWRLDVFPPILVVEREPKDRQTCEDHPSSPQQHEQPPTSCVAERVRHPHHLRRWDPIGPTTRLVFGPRRGLNLHSKRFQIVLRKSRLVLRKRRKRGHRDGDPGMLGLGRKKYFGGKRRRLVVSPGCVVAHLALDGVGLRSRAVAPRTAMRHLRRLDDLPTLATRKSLHGSDDTYLPRSRDKKSDPAIFAKQRWRLPCSIMPPCALTHTVYLSGPYDP